MKVTCPTCQAEYDDALATTICPHATFKMHSTVGDGFHEGCAHTTEEAFTFTQTGKIPNPECPVLKSMQAARAAAWEGNNE